MSLRNPCLFIFFLSIPYAGQAIAQSAVPSCPGCMPRAGQNVDSTNVKPAPSFQTTASTGAVYIPPRVETVTVTVPAPVPGDPTSFEASLFVCSQTGNDAVAKAGGAVVEIYKSELNRCGDSGGIEFWGAPLANCVASKVGGWPAAHAAPQTAFYRYAIECGTKADIVDAASSDVASVNAVCSKAATGLGYGNAASYNYVYGKSSRTCRK